MHRVVELYLQHPDDPVLEAYVAACLGVTGPLRTDDGDLLSQDRLDPSRVRHFRGAEVRTARKVPIPLEIPVPPDLDPALATLLRASAAGSGPLASQQSPAPT